jgi:hypothetical protein
VDNELYEKAKFEERKRNREEKKMIQDELLIENSTVTND